MRGYQKKCIMLFFRNVYKYIITVLQFVSACTVTIFQVETSWDHTEKYSLKNNIYIGRKVQIECTLVKGS
jgi:hypothetical protein